MRLANIIVIINGLDDWQIMSYNSLLEHHNCDVFKWVMRMGLHENNRRTLSLDFDVCGPKDDTGNRMGCPETTAFMEQYLNGVGDTSDGIFTSSTAGNMNVLVDYTNSPLILSLIEQINVDNETEFKFQIAHLEILLKGNQVIPLTYTNCKISGELGNAREFRNDNMFYVINDDDAFVALFVKDLFMKHFAEQTAPKQPKLKLRVKNTGIVPNITMEITEEIADLKQIKEHGELFNEIFK